MSHPKTAIYYQPSVGSERGSEGKHSISKRVLSNRGCSLLGHGFAMLQLRAREELVTGSRILGMAWAMGRPDIGYGSI